MMTHTPGPWTAVREAAIDYRPMQVIGASGDSRVARCIAVCEGGGPVRAVDAAEERANAYLLAAAPELFEALKACLEYIPSSEVRNWPPGFALRKKAIELGLAAIDKAQGP